MIVKYSGITEKNKYTREEEARRKLFPEEPGSNLGYQYKICTS